MEKLKNFIYDKNDIVVALVIIALATIVITGRINAIMAYPQTLSAQTEAQDKVTVTEPAITASAITTSDSTSTGSNGSATVGSGTPATTAPVTPTVVTPPVVTPPAAATIITITIPSGASGDAIGKILVANGLIAQKSDFINAVVAAAADKKLKAGTFKIPTGSSPAQIVAIITN